MRFRGPVLVHKPSFDIRMWQYSPVVLDQFLFVFLFQFSLKFELSRILLKKNDRWLRLTLLRVSNNLLTYSVLNRSAGSKSEISGQFASELAESKTLHCS